MRTIILLAILAILALGYHVATKATDVAHKLHERNTIAYNL